VANLRPASLVGVFLSIFALGLSLVSSRMVLFHFIDKAPLWAGERAKRMGYLSRTQSGDILTLILLTKSFKMASSGLEKDIRDIQEKLTSLTRQIEKFEAESQATISADHSMMLSQLRESVESVYHTKHFLETGHSRVIKHIDMIPGAWVEDRPTKDAVKLHSEDIHAKFTSLRDTTKSALVRVEEIKEKCDDFDVSLDRIKNEVNAVMARAKGALDTAKSSLISKKTQLANTMSSLTEKQGQMQRMEAEMRSKKDDRDIMRVVSGYWHVG